MSDYNSPEYKWNADAFDAIRIVATNGEFSIVGENTREIVLETDDSRRRHFGSEPHIAGRWLELHPFGGSSEWNLALPASKAWVIEISAASGEVQIQNLHARINAQLGSGEIHLENCRGVFNLRSGSGEVEMENCVQTDAPQAPERREHTEHAQGIPPIPPTPGIPPIPPIPPVPPIGIKVKVGKGVRFENRDDWAEYGQQWEEWGERFAEQASRWADKFSREFGGMFNFNLDDEERADGFHIRIGSGDVRIQEIDAQLVTARVGSGDIQIEQGRIAELDLESSRGDIQVESVLPTQAWALETRHGEIQIVLPGDAYARIDAATRHGDIESNAELVRVGRPGPGARHGGRMVGTIGDASTNSAQGEPVDIHLESQHGDIDIQVERRPSRFAGQAAPRSKKQERSMARQESPVPVPSTPVATSAQPTANAVVPVTVTDLTEPEAALNPPKESRVQVYDSQFAILQALQTGEITVAEAEMLLQSLKN